MIGSRLRAGMRRVVPLAARKRMAVLLNRLPGVPDRYWWTMELLRDYATADPNGFHRFLWSNHLAYAESYDVASRFGGERIHPTRVMLFEDLERYLRADGIDPARDIRSVFEVGSSLGYLLRHLETGLFAGAERLFGVDIDAEAIASGSEYLAGVGSRVRLAVADMAGLDAVARDEDFDVVLCAGVLMYLKPADAQPVVDWMVRHTKRVLVIAGLAHPDRDNRELTESAVRQRDGTFIHNLDAMVAAAGGRVRWRRWEGARMVDGNTIYFLFVEPSGSPA